MESSRDRLARVISKRAESLIRDLQKQPDMDPVLSKKLDLLLSSKSIPNVLVVPELFTPSRLNLFSLSYVDAVSFARFVGLTYPFLAPRARLLKWIDWIQKDDQLLSAEGFKSLSVHDTSDALEERCLSALGSNPRKRLNTHLAFMINWENFQAKHYPKGSSPTQKTIKKGATASALIVARAFERVKQLKEHQKD